VRIKAIVLKVHCTKSEISQMIKMSSTSFTKSHNKEPVQYSQFNSCLFYIQTWYSRHYRVSWYYYHISLCRFMYYGFNVHQCVQL